MKNNLGGRLEVYILLNFKILLVTKTIALFIVDKDSNWFWVNFIPLFIYIKVHFNELIYDKVLFLY